MDLSEPKPRVNFKCLQQYVGRRVLLVGAVEQAAPGSVQIRTSDNGNVTIQTTAPPDYSNSEIVEFDVNVTGPNIVQENSHTRLSSGFDMENYEELVKLIHEHGRTILLP